MERLIEIFNWIGAHYQEIISAVNGIIAGLIVIFMLVPGPQPEAFLKKLADFLSKFSKK